jgi:hypothetical protein
MATFNKPIKGTFGNWNSGTDANSLIKPKKQLAMGGVATPTALPNGRRGGVRDTGKIGRSLKRIDMTPSGSKP